MTLFSYEPYEPRMFPLFIYYIILVILSSIFTIKMYLKWRERRVKPPLYLTIVFMFITMTISSLTIGLGEVIITGWKKEIYRITLPLAYTFFIISNWFLFLFISHMTSVSKKSFKYLIIIGIVVSIMMFLPWNYYGQPPEDYEGKLNIRLYSTVSFVLYSLIFYGFIAYVCQRSRKKSEDKKVRWGFNLLTLSMFSMIGFFILLVLENAVIVFLDHPGFSIFFFLAWGVALLFLLFAYLALEMPSWLVRLIEK
ncbi:MAG: hypothetical protein GF353_23570 [Candidatus Lokiarchaeota archaeon]|nr:hypothetical protein [Candidatus Lokiarchaeota archaeon]